MVVEADLGSKAPVTDTTLVGLAVGLLSAGVMVTLVLLEVGELGERFVTPLYGTLVRTFS